MLRGIEQRVLNDVWMGALRRGLALVCALVLAVAAVGRWMHWGAHVPPVGHADVVARGTAIMFLLASGISLTALRRRRFRWCCGAAYVSALSTVTSIAALWWHQTAHGADPLVWTLVAMAASAVSALTWIVTILTPLDRSQPEMRSGSAGLR